MKAVKLRFLIIGGINAAIGVIVILARGFSQLVMGYIILSLAILLLGVLIK